MRPAANRRCRHPTPRRASTSRRWRPVTEQVTLPVDDKKPKFGHVSGTSHPESRMNSGSQKGALAYQAVVPVPPRLLELDDAAAYLGVSPWTVRALEAAGTLRRVCIPTEGGRDLRKLLYDRDELDR